MHKINAVLLDADGVINDGKLFSLEPFGIDSKIITPFFVGPFQDALVGKADLRELLEQHAPTWGWKGTVEELMNYWFTSGHLLNQEVIDAAQKLRKASVPVYVATNQEHYRTEYMKEMMEYDKLFDGVFSSAMLGHKKPQAEFFDAIHKQTGEHDPKTILFWDDTPSYLEGGKQFGLTSHLFTSIDDFRKTMKGYFTKIL